MEIKNQSKFKSFFKRYGVLSLACVIALTVALSIGLNMPSGETPVNTQDTTFALPMKNAVVVKDYADDRLQLNETLKRWEIHLAIDFTSSENSVFSVLDGTVAKIETNSLDGTIVQIDHADGFSSIYSSLNSELKIKEGDKVKKGQELGSASDSAKNENIDGGHLHFVLLKDGQEVDPNNYLDLQNK